MLGRRILVAALLGTLVLLGTTAAYGAVTWRGTSSTGTAATWHDAQDAPAGGEGASAATAELVPVTKESGVLKTTGSQGVALTFDDGPDPTYTPQMLALLRQHGVKATFCLVGVNAQQYPQLVQAIVRDGHSLCNHTWRHDLKLGSRSTAEIRSDLQRTNDAIHQAVPGAPIQYFRHPGGNWTNAAVAVAAELGMASIGWEVDPLDWNLAKYPAGPTMRDHIVNVLTTQVKPGSIVLSHDAGGDRSSTLAAYQTVLPQLKERFTLVALRP
jgi:peptidoglycan-N-acetylglucosamine deacetylase